MTEATFAASRAEYSNTRGSKPGVSCAPTSCRRARRAFVSFAASRLSLMTVRATAPLSAVTSTMTVRAAPGSRAITRPVRASGCPSTAMVATGLSAVAVRVTEATFTASRAV